MLRTLVIVVLTFGLGVACGGDKPSNAGDKSKTPAVVDAKPIDCAQFEKRVYECTAEFASSYAGTEFGSRLRGDTPEKKAEAITKGLEILKTIKGQNACENGPSWGNLSQKDPRWRARYHKCKADAPCAEWGKCVGEALGQPLKIN